jgi:hypothetical protein
MAIVSLERPDIQTNMEPGVNFSFSKDASTKLYQMMSNYLYSDKEYAVISELSANAIDAHQLVGKQDVPIEVQLPTHIDNEFVVRDFGPGLSEEDVYRFLTSYGESSKGDSNEQIGFWGIGAKSPAAVSDNWTILSYHGGKKMHFEVFITSDGIPTLKKIFETTSEDTGLEVRVPVPNPKHRQWIESAERAYKYYEVKPTVNETLRYEKASYTMRGEGWARAKGYSKGGRLVVTMREYTLDYTKIMGQLDAASPIRKLFFNNFNGVDLFFGVGEIELSISREQVQYSDKTMKAITTRLQEVYDAFHKMVSDDLAKAENSIEYRKLASDWHHIVDIGPTFLAHVIDGKHGIQKIPQDIQSIVVAGVDTSKMSVVHNHSVKSLKGRFNCWGRSIINKNERWSSTTAQYESSVYLSVAELDNIQVVIRDVNDPHARIKNDGDKNKFYLVVTDNVFPAELKPVLASSFAKPPKEGKVAKENITNFYILSGNRFTRIAAADYELFKNSTTTVAVKIINATSIDNNPEALTQEVSFLRRVGWNVIGYKGDTPPATLPLVPAAMQTVFKSLKDDTELAGEIKQLNLKSMFTQVMSHVPSMLVVMGVIKNSPLTDVEAAYAPMINHYATTQTHTVRSYFSSKFNDWKRVCELLKVDDQTSGVTDLTPYMELLDSKYPMLNHVNYGWYSSQNPKLKNSVLDYVELINKSLT